ncbi:MAG: 2-C-methyl-D-erythritol 4-phosphate cytidylyltransferase [Bacteroidota bacterium]
MRRYAIIVAGGKGTRMNSDVPKQFLLIDGEPIIVRTIRVFLKADSGITPIIVIPKESIGDWNLIKERHLAKVKVIDAVGGETRTSSVLSGLQQITDDGVVAIHDAVRPYVSPKIILNSFESAEIHGSGVVCIPLKDSIRELTGGDTSVSRNRNDFVLVQTPQTFIVSKIKDAYRKVGDHASHTDDASVYEGAGYKVAMVTGSYANIKITTPEDLKA